MGTAQATGTVFGPRFDVGREPWAPRLGWAATAAHSAIPLVVALAVFLPHSLALRDWLIDDAGISFAYARSLAQGHGLVAQAGVPPVEGFSNPLWTLLLSGLFATGLFDLAWTPKVLSFALVAATFMVIARGRAETSWPRAAGTLVALLLLALNTGFVVWTSSGLENPLLAFLAALSCVVSARAVASASSRLERAAGAIAGLLALTRPDAVVYAAAYPALLLSIEGLTKAGMAQRARSLGQFAVGFVPLWGGYLLFRRWYFGAWLPNTFHAKEKPSVLGLFDVAKLEDLLQGAVGRMALPAVLFLVLGGAWLFARRRADDHTRSVFVHLGLATASYLVMPADWMGEYRFATAFFLFFAWALSEVASGRAAPGGRVSRPMVAAATAFSLLLILETSITSAPRSAAFAANPVVPLSKVEAFGADGYNRLARILGATGASLMTPDVGGALLGSTLRIYDLVGLCDVVAARTLTHDTAAFHDYVFATARPTFIHVHGGWAQWAALGADPRLQRDYAPLWEVWASDGGSDPWSADYVRRDALAGDPSRLAALRRAFVEMGLPRLNP
jgi:hypothetical protein